MLLHVCAMLACVCGCVCVCAPYVLVCAPPHFRFYCRPPTRHVSQLMERLPVERYVRMRQDIASYADLGYRIG